MNGHVKNQIWARQTKYYTIQKRKIHSTGRRDHWKQEERRTCHVILSYEVKESERMAQKKETE